MEGDPFVDGGLEYLFGITEVVGAEPVFHAFWGHDRAGEKAAFEGLVDLVVARLERDPGLHVYHYASYEATALKRLMSRHATREDEVDRLLRGGVLVDLHQVVRQGVCVSKESYSLKTLEAYYMSRRDEAIADAASSIVAYERWVETRDDRLLEQIERYNERDCDSTRLLRDWLEERRDELAALTGSAVQRPSTPDGEPSEALAEASAQTRELVEQLIDRGGEDPDARRLLAHLLDWHRREDKAAWWAFYDRCAKTDEELVDDAEAIGAVTHLGAVRPEKKSVVHRYAFDPAQEHKLDPGDKPCDPRTGRGCGEIVALDNIGGVVELKRGASLDDDLHPTSLIPGGPIPTRPMREALQRLAAWVIDNGVACPGRHRAVRDLIAGRPPRVSGHSDGTPLVAPGAEVVEAACSLVRRLDSSYLPVQGPPGCGKTYTGAQVIVDLVGAGRRVGVSATTHRAIGRLLEEVGGAAARLGVPVRIMQKCDAGQMSASPGAIRATDNDAVIDALRSGEADVVAGTAWLFADPRLEGVLDVVVIDEAGQMSLANACAVGTAARSLVLLGDPQQLAQPSQGVHPPGAEASALEHVLAGRDTIPPERGVFLPTTWRMHPAVCAFVSTAFYEDRLTSLEACARQRLHADAELRGAGIRLACEDHAGNRTWSPEELAAVRVLVNRLLTATWTDSDGADHPLGLDDILVVAPYNAQVKRLRDALPAGARVGTVDRFQGQEAPVTIYSMATSSADDVPRNAEFLLSRNRLNVAVSRAQAVSIVVCSTRLLAVRCRTPEQLRLANALCRYAEMASPVTT
jgi:AAA domain-containing protein/RNase H-like protein